MVNHCFSWIKSQFTLSTLHKRVQMPSVTAGLLGSLSPFWPCELSLWHSRGRLPVWKIGVSRVGVSQNGYLGVYPIFGQLRMYVRKMGVSHVIMWFQTTVDGPVLVCFFGKVSPAGFHTDLVSSAQVFWRANIWGTHPTSRRCCAAGHDLVTWCKQSWKDFVVEKNDAFVVPLLNLRWFV